MAMYEDVTYSDHGRVHENSFMQYKVPSRLDIGKVQVEFECSYEPTGPFGAKSIGEIVINTPSPAIANAVYNAVGVRIRNCLLQMRRSLWGSWVADERRKNKRRRRRHLFSKAINEGPACVSRQ